MSATNPGYTVVTDLKTAGAIIWWRLSGPVFLERLREAWANAGLSARLLPDNPSPQVALTRAASEQGGTRRLIRPMAGGKGWAVVDEVPQADGTLVYATLAQLTLKEGKLHILDGTDMTPRSDGLTAAEILKLRDDFEAFQKQLTINDVSAWLTKLVKPELKAVSLRDTGGVYFVPREYLDTYGKMVKAIYGASEHLMFEVPALKSDEAVNAILDALLREADGECESMETELDTGNLKKRALQARKEKCEGLRLKVEEYEKLLGRSMTAVRERIDNLKASVVDAALSMTAEEESA